MEFNKPKRLRKPLGAIKVASNTKTPVGDRKSPERVENGLKQPVSTFHGREFSQFYLDEVKSRR